MKSKNNRVLIAKILFALSFVLLLGFGAVWGSQDTAEKEDLAYSLFVAEDNVALAENGGTCVRRYGFVHPFCGYQPHFTYVAY